jgi:hypothetical protein
MGRWCSIACKLGLEGIVSKRRDSPYSSGRSPHWIKSKNPNAPAVKREAEEWGHLISEGGLPAAPGKPCSRSASQFPGWSQLATSAPTPRARFSMRS